jgi:hypothetical protein
MRIVPNSSLYKGSFSNLSRPDLLRTEIIELGFSYDDPPNKVKRVLMDTLLRTQGVLTDPAPAIRTLSYGDFAINYRVIFTVPSQERLAVIRDEFMTRVWYAAGRHGLNIPYPIATQIEIQKAEMDAARRVKPEELFRSFPQFAPKNSEGEARLGAGAVVRLFAQGERVVVEGENLSGLHLILQGKAALTVRDRAGIEQEIARLGKGEYFGEQSILSIQVSEVTVTAVEDLEVLVLDSETLNTLLDEMPRLAREIGSLMDIRRKGAQSVRKLKPTAK